MEKKGEWLMHIRTSTPLTPIKGLILGLIFLAVGIGVLFMGASQKEAYDAKNATYIETTAIVVDYDYNSDGLQAIIVEYEVDGEKYTKISNTYSNMAKPLGTEVQVKYNPDLPKDAIWVNDSNNIVMPIFGGAFSFFGVLAMFAGFKKKKRPEIEEVVY